jgi:hypothetical protein
MAIYQKITIDPRFEKLPLKKLIVIFFILNLITIAFGLLAQFILPPEIPLLFGLPQTTEQLTPSIYIILPAITALIISFLNSLIAINLDGQYIKKTLAFSTALISILSLVATFKIIFLVGSI